MIEIAYEAYITRLKNVEKHSNADRLQKAQCFGNQVIVDLSYKEGDLGVYFPSDGKLGQEFAEANNLLRKKDQNGNNVGGFIDPVKRNIKAIKLRGEKSDGLFLRLDSLSKFTDISTLKEGDTITALNGTLICEKYVPKRNARSGGNIPKQKKANKIKYPWFAEHEDTKQLMYYLRNIHPGDICTLTLKMHGCFTGETKVRMADGSLKQIKKIQIGDEVLGYDFNLKHTVPTRVTNVFHNDSSNNWNKLKFSRKHMAGDKRGYITATHNHPFWWDEEGKWIAAEGLKPGDTISTLVPSKILTKQQKEILVGSFLGDGCVLEFEGMSAELQSGCKESNQEYLDYMVEIMNGLYYRCSGVYTSGYGSRMVRGKTYRAPDIRKYFNNLITFNNGSTGGKLKPGLIEEFTPLSMAIFYMEDGSLQHNEYQEDRALFAICDYTDVEDCSIICKCFEKFGITPTLYTDSRGYNRIRLNTKDAYKMFDMIYKFIPPIMRYKLPELYRDKEYIPPVDENSMIESYILMPQTVLENIKDDTRHKEYDLETELHNYIVGASIVHNTSARTANTVREEKPKQNFWQRLWHKKTEPIRSWGAVSGSRRVTLDFDNEEVANDGWYGNNEFRKKWHDFIAPKLHKGEEVFYEIVGYVDENTLIMPQGNNKKVGDAEFVKQYGDTTEFTYGCKPGENEAYVYRMTKTDEDGYVVEYPDWYMRVRAEQMGLKVVPKFEDFIYTTEKTMLKRVDKYIDGPDPIGKTHVREGVVLRVQNRNKFEAYKNKNFSFKCLEGIIKDSAAVPDMEEAQEEAAQ